MLAAGRLSDQGRRRVRFHLPERCDLGVKIAAFAALGEIAALRDEGVRDPLVLACSGVKEGESTLKRFILFSLWPSLAESWMYGQADGVTARSRGDRRALTVLIAAVAVDGNIAAEGVLRF